MSIQGSREWLLERLGYVTCSRFSDVMTSPRKKGGISATANTYLMELLTEHLTGEPTEEIKAKQLEWGEKWEPVARLAYARFMKYEVVEVGFVKHATEALIGASPDCLVADDGMAEIKCPMTGKNHLRVLMSKEIPDEHFEQVQGGLWVTGRKWCDFVSYHDRFPSQFRLQVIRAYADPQWQQAIANMVIPFRDLMVQELEKLLAMWNTEPRVNS